MTTNDSTRAAPAPRAAVDPGLPAETRALLLSLDPLTLPSPSDPAPDIRTPGILAVAAEPLKRLVWLTLGVAALCPLFAVLFGDLAGLPYGRALQVLLVNAAALATIAFWVIVALANRRLPDQQRPARLLKDAHGRYLGPEEFMPDAAAVLARAQVAADSVLRTQVHERGLLDRSLNLSALPVFEWEIAQALGTYSREAMSLPAWPAGDNAARVLDAGRAGLKRRLEGIILRVEHMEEYAATAATAEALHNELVQLQGISGRGESPEEVLALMARGEQAGVVGALDQAVAAARAAGAAALKGS